MKPEIGKPSPPALPAVEMNGHDHSSGTEHCLICTLAKIDQLRSDLTEAMEALEVIQLILTREMADVAAGARLGLGHARIVAAAVLAKHGRKARGYASGDPRKEIA